MDEYQPDAPYTYWKNEAQWMSSLHDPLRQVFTMADGSVYRGQATSAAHWKAVFGLCGSHLSL